MVKLYDGGVYLVNGNEIVPEAEAARVEQMTGKKRLILQRPKKERSHIRS